MLNPFLTKVAYGMVLHLNEEDQQVRQGRAYKVIYPDDLNGSTVQPIEVAQDFVAWPYGDYPGEYFIDGAILSFAAIPSRTDYRASANVDFSGANIQVTKRGGSDIGVTDISFDNRTVGLINNIQWKMLLERNVVYDVTISNVVTSGLRRNYSYWFRVNQSEPVGCGAACGSNGKSSFSSVEGSLPNSALQAPPSYPQQMR